MLPINDIKQLNDKGAMWRLNSDPKLNQPQPTFPLQSGIFTKTPLSSGGVLRNEVVRPPLFPQPPTSLQAQLAYIKMAAELFAGNSAAATGNLVASQFAQRHPSALRLMNPMLGGPPQPSQLWPGRAVTSSYPVSLQS